MSTVPCSLFPVPYSLFPIPCSRQLQEVYWCQDIKQSFLFCCN
ncbi:hypothetical protein [Moorena producens]|nr:hypothetical protein [Moorena producens]